MPELPEVETTVKSLNILKNKKVINLDIHTKKLRYSVPHLELKKIINYKIIKLRRIAKYVIIDFNNSMSVIIHLGMSGRLKIIKINMPIKNHDHLVFKFNNIKLIYNDPRRFGFFKTLNSKKKMNEYFKKIGPEPFDSTFSIKYLQKKMYNKDKNIKNFLLDQSFVAGIGNIYANEILFYSKINPLKKGKEISENEIRKIIKYSKQVLKKAIKKGGSSIKNFKNIKGINGSYQKEFKIYDKEDKICPTSNCNEKIVKLNISNRSTYVCNVCQK